MTQSYVNNTGINLDDVKSSERFTGDLFICSLYDLVSNWRCSETLSEYLGMSIVMSMRKDLITDLSCSKSYELKDNTDLEWEFSADSSVQRLHMVVYGFGAKNILRSIASYGCKITVVPSTNLSSEVFSSRMICFSAMDLVASPQFPMPLKLCRIWLAKSQALEIVWVINN